MDRLDDYEQLLTTGTGFGIYLMCETDEAKWEEWWAEMRELLAPSGIRTVEFVESCGAGSYYFPALRLLRPDGSEYATAREWGRKLDETKRRIREDWGDVISRERLRIEKLRPGDPYDLEGPPPRTSG